MSLTASPREMPGTMNRTPDFLSQVPTPTWFPQGLGRKQRRSSWLLLGERRGWIELLPAALATSVCWLGAMIVFRITMSKTITSDYRKYGDIGVVFAVMSVLIAIGVVIIIGAVFGKGWHERRDNTADATQATAAASTTRPQPDSIPAPAREPGDRSTPASGRRRRRSRG